MTSPLGAAAALGSSCTWAYASTRYAVAAREVSPVRVNLFRMIYALPFFVAGGLWTGTLGRGLTLRHLGLLLVSTLCSYAFADNVFFAAARRIGVSSALAIASSYPLWAALKGTLIDHQPFGPARAVGTALCVGGVVAIIRLREPPLGDAAPRDRRGVPLAIATSVLWAGNSISIKAGAAGLSLPTVNAVRYAMAIAILGALVVAGRAAGARGPVGGWRSLAPAMVLDSLLGSVLFIYGLRETDLAVGATLSSLAPLVSLPIAVWLRVERLSPAKVVAVAVTVGGIALLASS